LNSSVRPPVGVPLAGAAFGGDLRLTRLPVTVIRHGQSCSHLLARGHCVMTPALKASIRYADVLTAGSFRLSMTLDRMGVG
jgi:hypothetical protein